MPAFSGAGSEGFVWIVPPTVMMRNIELTRRATLRRAHQEFDDFAGEVEQWMKDNHPWNNRTNTAEDSLVASVSSQEIKGFGPIARGSMTMTMEIGYDMNVMRGHPDGRQRDYSIYLEGYLNLGIIQPTMAVKAPEAMDRFDGIMTM